MYRVVQGSVVTEDSSKAFEPSKNSTDDQHIKFPLEFRLSRLDKLIRVKKFLRNLELYIVLESSDTNLSHEGIQKRLAIFRTKLDLTDLRVECESPDCKSGNKRIAVYLNLCDGCNPKNAFNQESTERLTYNLITLKNLINKVSFLESRIGASLNNQLTDDELESALLEAKILDQILV